MDIGVVRRRKGEFQLVLWVKEDNSLVIKLFCEESELFYQLVVDQRWIKNHHDMATFFASPRDLQYTLIQLFDGLDISAEGTITLTLELLAAKINMTKVYVLKLQPSAEGELQYLRRKLSELKQESEQSLLSKDREIQSLIDDKQKLQQALSLCEEEVGRLQEKIQELSEDIKEREAEIQRYRQISNSERQAKIRLESVIETSREHFQGQQLLFSTLQSQQQNASLVLNKLSTSLCEANPHIYHFHYRYSPSGLTVIKKSQNGWSNFISGWAVHDTQVTRFQLAQFKMRDGSLAVGVGSEAVFLNGAIEHPEYVAYFCRDGRIYDSGVRRVNGRPIVSDDGMAVTIDRANATVTWHSNSLQIGRTNLSPSTRLKRLYLIAKVFWKQDEFTLQC